MVRLRPVDIKSPRWRGEDERRRLAGPALVSRSRVVELERKAHTGFEPVSAETEVPEPLRRKLDELRAQSKKRVDERR